MKKVVIAGFSNCKQKNITGVPRVFREIILRLDKMIAGTDLTIEYAVSEGAENRIVALDELHNIKPIIFPKKKFSLISSIFTLPKYLRREHAVGISLDFNVIRHRGFVASLPDIRPAVYRQYDSRRHYFVFNHFTVPIIKKYSSFIITDSDYQKDLIAKYLAYPLDRIKTVYLGWEHMNDLVADENIFTRFPTIKSQQYFYTLGSVAPHKNYRWVYEVAKRNPNHLFVVAGRNDTNFFDGQEKLLNVVYTGYVSDAENKALMTHCRAFLLPSKFEGFGLPPLEALACGAPICLARATCLPEIYGDCAHYFDPDDYNVDLDKLLSEPVNNPQVVLQKYSWDNTARAWYDIIKSVAKE